MTLPAAALPDLMAFGSLLSRRRTSGSLWTAGRADRRVRFFARGRWALAAGVEAVREAASRDSIVVWLPNFICGEALGPLRNSRARLRFYPVEDDLRPRWSFFESVHGGGGEPALFVLVHYFGFANDVENARRICESRGWLLLEDAAHVLRPHGPIGGGDIAVFSPHKLLPIPTGGVLTIPSSMFRDSPESFAPASAAAFWLARRMGQRALVRLGVPWHWSWRKHTEPSSLGPGTDCRRAPPPCDAYSMKSLAALEPTLSKVVDRRLRNYRQMLRYLAEFPQAAAFHAAGLEGACPYVFAFRLPFSGSGIVALLRARGVPAVLWPDIPAELTRSDELGRPAFDLAERTVLLPIHQSLDSKQIDWMGETLLRLLRSRAGRRG